MSPKSMWHFICERISEATNQTFICNSKKEVQGGDTHAAFVLTGENKRYFVKIYYFGDDTQEQLTFEAEGLRALKHNSSNIVIPQVVSHGTIKDEGKRAEYLVLNHIHFTQADQGKWHQLGQHLAQLHKTSAYQRYGWHRDNYIGAGTQRNGWSDSWAQFFAEQRIGAMLDTLASQGHRLTNIDIFVTRVEEYLADHQPQPALLHGDLWSGNVGFCSRGPVIFDPAVYVGDREADLAMTEMFGKFPTEFYQGYNQRWPLDERYDERKKLYNCYHLLNHAALFGGGYLSSAASTLNQLNQLFAKS